MKKLVLGLILGISVLTLTSCTEKERARNFGGESTTELEPGQQLINATWKKNDLWLLTTKRPDSVEPQTYYFSEDSSYGVMEGTIIIKEK